MQDSLIFVPVTARHSNVRRLTDRVILNFNSNMYTAAVFWDIEESFNAAWHLVCYKNYRN
jgi:hypothetical protein